MTALFRALPGLARGMIPAAAVTILAYWDTIASYPRIWNVSGYAHAYLLVAAVPWLVWRTRHALSPRGPFWIAAAEVAAGLSVLWFMARAASVSVGTQVLFPLAFACGAASVLGKGSVKHLGPLTALFMLGVPIWSVLNAPLQLLTVVASSIVLVLVQVPAQIDGTVIHIQAGTFLVESGCSGLNYLISGLSVGGLYSLAFLRSWNGRLKVLGMAAALAIVGNWIRVITLILVGHVTEMRSSLMEGHLWLGWVIFFAGLTILFPFARKIELHEASEGWGATDDGAMVAAPPAFSSSLLAAGAAVCLGPVLYLAIDLLPLRPVEPSDLSPAGPWVVTSVTEPAGGWRPGFSGASEQSVTAWTDGTREVFVDRLRYAAQSQGAELIGFESRIAPPSLLALERMLGPVGADRRYVNEAVVAASDVPVLVWYWYNVAGLETASRAKAKLLEMIAFIARREGSELIALSTPCQAETCVEAAAALSSFLGDEP